jgi:hypothetical protein
MGISHDTLTRYYGEDWKYGKANVSVAVASKLVLGCNCARAHERDGQRRDILG